MRPTETIEGNKQDSKMSIQFRKSERNNSNRRRKKKRKPDDDEKKKQRIQMKPIITKEPKDTQGVVVTVTPNSANSEKEQVYIVYPQQQPPSFFANLSFAQLQSHEERTTHRAPRQDNTLLLKHFGYIGDQVSCTED